jgi:hypothetical protein
MQLMKKIGIAGSQKGVTMLSVILLIRRRSILPGSNSAQQCSKQNINQKDTASIHCLGRFAR